MKLFRLIAWAAWFMLCMISHAYAGPVAAAIGAIAGILKAGGIAALLVKAAFGVALQLGASLLQRAQAKKQAQPGISGQMKVGGDNSFAFIVGDWATAGSLDYIGTWGKAGKTPNAYLTQVLTVSDLPQSGLASRIFINNEKCEIDFEADVTPQGYPVKEFRRGGVDYLWVKMLDGSQLVADPLLLSSFGDADARAWMADMIGSGSTVVIMTTRYNRKLFTSFPVGRYEPGSIPLYDPRKDDTAGGDGPHRWGQPETYEPSANNIVIVYNILRGIYYGGERIYGPGISAPRLPLASWFAAMNECDVPITIKSGGTEPQFRGGFEIQVAEHQPADVIDELLKGCNGQIAEIGGVYKVRVGPPGLPVMFVTDEDFVITDPQELDPFKGLEATINGATASYPDPAAAWEMKDAPQRLFPALEAQDDDRRLLANFQFNAVSRPRQVQRLMKSMVLDGRRMRSHRGTLPPFAFALEPLDVISWSSARNGYIDKLFDIRSKDEMANVNQSVALIEVDPNDYDWTPNTDELPWVVGDLDPLRPPVQSVTGFQVFADTINDNVGRPRRPVIRVLYDGDLDDVRAVGFEIKLNAAVDDDLIAAGDFPYGDPTTNPDPKDTRINNTLPPATDLEARFIYLPFSGRDAEWSSWLPVTTSDTRLTDDDVYLPGMLEDLEERFQDFDDFINAEVDELEAQIEAETDARVTQILSEQEQRIAETHQLAGKYRALIDEVGAVRDLLANATFDGYQHVEQLRTVLTSRVNEVYAEFDQRIVVATGDNSGLVQRLTRLETGNADLTALVGEIETASVDGLNALAQQISLLSAGTNNQFDPAQLWNFLTTIEGWTGNGTPTFDASGALRPADQASTPYVVSPVGLDIQATAYRQVRARVRKVGTPTWVGYAWWKTTTDSTWDSARRTTISEPSYDGNGYGLITFQMDWANTIDSIRLELSAAQTSSNYFLIDWVGIGSPSPGASRAELLAEKTARIAADTAQASSITVLQAAINSPTSGLNALSTAVNAIDTRVVAAEGSISAFGAVLNGLETEVDGKASIDSVQALQNDIDALDVGGISSIGSSVTSIRNELLPMASQLMEQGFQQFLANMENKRIIADVSQSLTTRIEQTNDNLFAVSTSLTKTQAEIPNLAKATAVQALDSRLVANESLTAAAGTALSQVKAELGWDDAASTGSRATALNILEADVAVSYGLASAKNKVYRQTTAPVGTTAVPLVAGDLWIDTANDNLTKRWSGSAWVDVTDARITSSAASITSIKSELGWDDAQPSGGKATGLSVIRTNVENVVALADAKNKIYRQSTAPTGTTAVPLRAGDVWFDTANDSRPKRWSGSAWVDVSDARVQASADLLQSISATVDDNSANARFRMTTITGPSGFARIAARVKYAAGETERSAGWYVDVPSDSGLDSVFLIEADQFAVRNGSAKKYPMTLSGGVLRLRDIVLQNADIANLNVDWAKITNVSIKNADIDNLAVKTSNLDFSAVTSWGAGDTGGAETLTGGNDDWETLYTIVLANPNPNPVWVSVEYTLTAGHSGFAAQHQTTNLRLIRSGSTVFSRTVGRSNSAGAGTTTVSDIVMLFDPDTSWAGGNRTYSIQASRAYNGAPGTSTVDVKVTLLTWKR